MHKYIINATLQVVPIATEKHPYLWIDEAIAIIQQSGIKYEVGAFATTLEGSYDVVMKLIHDVNEYLREKRCEEWITNIQLQNRSNDDITGDEKTLKFS
jgi:uncharacterized protein YqgV (UPF0045/DUF77 family)